MKFLLPFPHVNELPVSLLLRGGWEHGILLFVYSRRRNVAQVVERTVRDREVAGSSPVIPTNTLDTL